MKNKQFNNLTCKDGGIAFSAMLIVYVFLSFVGQAVCISAFGVDSFECIAISPLFSTLALMGVVLYYKLTKCVSFCDITGLNKFNPIWVFVAVILSVGMFFCFGFINDAFANALDSIGVNIASVNIPLEKPMHLITFSVTLALLPALSEEFFFRGLVYNSLSRVKTVFVIIIIAVCFALYHGSLAQLIYQLIYGASLALLRKVANSSIPCIVAHFINNFAILLFEYFNVQIDLYSPYLISFGLVLVGAFAFVCIRKLRSEQACVDSAEKAREFWIPFGIFGAVICSVLALSVFLV